MRRGTPRRVVVLLPMEGNLSLEMERAFSLDLSASAQYY